MLRSFLLKTALRAKAHGGADFMTRYNPVIRPRVLRALELLREQSDSGTGDLEQKLAARIMRAACRTRYGAGRPADISEWPVLEKNAVRDAPRDFLAPGPAIRIPAETAGSTGTPLKIWRSLESIVAEQAFIDGLLAPYGFSMRSRVAVLRGDYVKHPSDASPPYGRITQGGGRLVLSSFHLNRQTLPWFHDAIKSFAPDILWIYPNTAVNLLAILEQAGLKLSVPLILSSSEMLPDNVHRSLERNFGCPVINYYGQAERVCFAHSSKPGEFYFDPRYGHVELEGPELRPDGETSAAQVTGTSYWNAVMPLVRYRTGDAILVPSHYGAKELAEIAAGKRPFMQMAGREGEYILTRGGMRITVMNQIVRGIENVYQAQMIQPDFDTLLINIMSMPGFGAEDLAKIERQARERVPSSMRVSVHHVDRFQTTARGKVPLVIRAFQESAS